MKKLGIRWTIGDVSERGFTALGLSVRGAVGVFGPDAAYVVCVNSVAPRDAETRLPPLPSVVEVRFVDDEVPPFLRDRFDGRFAEGVGWKFAPPRLFPDRHELALDNDCILWRLPDALRRWLDADHAFALAADVVPAFGRFAPWCGAAPRNSGIRGLPPGFDLVAALERTLDRVDEPLSSELDEQGLQVATLLESGRVFTVPVADVAICSPFPPHVPDLGRCGAHFVGLNARTLPWSHDGRPADCWTREHFDRHLARVRHEIARATARLAEVG